MPSIPDIIAVVTLFGGIFGLWYGNRAGKAAPTPAPAPHDDAKLDRVVEMLIVLKAEVRGNTRALDRVEEAVGDLRR
ncbi:hypothetical protein [Hansschlegelia beijingensis]|uniref:Uncharacterized protein n=1 Tax=Hansschlegelia beijingensis TaxID=1133344 RepID=A0A7W6CXA3_9HYPH|nr:hypothetical protein [Hansschlegelia beijingensis]MBB3972801.1 hypothetical protein [Hansschlegelia beijingensis]